MYALELLQNVFLLFFFFALKTKQLEENNYNYDR